MYLYELKQDLTEIVVEMKIAVLLLNFGTKRVYLQLKSGTTSLNSVNTNTLTQ